MRRHVLERLARPLLGRFLETHASAWCAAHGLSPSAMAASDPRDREPITRLLERMQSAAPALPAEAREGFALLDVLACPRAGEQLIALDEGRALPRATLGDEDLALTALLEQPALARAAAALVPTDVADVSDGFTEYEPMDARPLCFGDAEAKALEAEMGAYFERLDRTRLCVVHVTRDGERTCLEIEYGRRATTRGKLDVATLSVEPSTQVNTDRAFVEIDAATGRLAIQAPHAGTKRALCEALGRVLAGNAAHFTAARVFDLAPFADLEAALSPRGVERLLGVAIHGIAVRTPKGSEVDVARPRKDVRDDDALAGVLAELPRLGAVVGVRLYLQILDRRAPVKVELSAREGRHRLTFRRSDPEVAAVVKAYLIARGILRELARGDDGDAAEASA